MVLPTFHHINDEKQARVTAALLHEFSVYPLAEAQVARIVTEAGIARGAFYKYFVDLTDAYRYLFDLAMAEIHRNMPQTPQPDNVEAYLDTLRHFITQTDQTGYRQLIELHYRYNEGFLGREATKVLEGETGSLQWAAQVLYHQTVLDILLDPQSAEQRIAQLRASLIHF